MAKIVSYVPLQSNPETYTPTKLTMRDEQLRRLYSVADRVKRESAPSTVCISGPKAMGKTVSVLHFIKELTAKDPTLPCVYLSCKTTLRESARLTFSNIPRSTSSVIDFLVNKGKLLFFDDVHNVNPEKFNLELKYLYDRYKGKVVPILMTNISFHKLQDFFTSEVLSRMSWQIAEFINFPSYSLTEIYNILIQRVQEALELDSWEEDAILKCAKYGAENKDVRLAIDLLKDSCEYKLGEPLKSEHVDWAIEEKGVQSLSLDLDNLTLHARLYLLSLCLAELKGITAEGVSLSRMDNLFEQLSERYDVKSISRVSRWRLRQKLQLEQFLDSTIKKFYTVDARGKKQRGTTVFLKLTMSPNAMLKAFEKCAWDDLFDPEELKKNIKSVMETTRI